LNGKMAASTRETSLMGSSKDTVNTQLNRLLIIMQFI
jgi:hypothetical protein